MKKIKYFILPFLAILGAVNVKAYDFSGINKSTRTEFGLYQDTTRLIQISCTSSNEGYCAFEDSDLPNSSNTYNNVLFHTRDTMNTTFQLGNQYKFSFYFFQYTAGYFLRSADITNVTGVSYRNFTNWTSDSMTVVSYNLTLLESENNKGLYRLDIIAIPTTTNIVGFSFRVYQDYETISNNNDCYFEGTTYFSISQLSPGQIDYTQDFNQVNQNISDLGDTITDNQNQNTQDIIYNQNQNAQDIQDTINNNFQSCRNSYNLLDIEDTSRTSNGITGTWNKGILTYNGTATGTFAGITYEKASILPAGTYTFSIDHSVDFQVRFRYLSDTSHDVIIPPGKTSTTFTSSENFVRLYVFINGLTINTSYNGVLKVQLETGSTVHSFESYGVQICTNKLDEQNNAINNINDSITDSTPPDTNALSNASGWLPPGPVDSILNLPLTLLQSLNNAFSSNSCQPISIDLPHISNRPLVIPCMSTVWQGFGLLTFFTWIGRVIGGVLLYKYLIGLYKWVDDTLTMRENNNFDDGSLG